MHRAVGDVSPLATCRQQTPSREASSRPSRSGRARAGAPATEHTAKALSSFTGGLTKRGLAFDALKRCWRERCSCWNVAQRDGGPEEQRSTGFSEVTSAVARPVRSAAPFGGILVRPTITSRTGHGAGRGDHGGMDPSRSRTDCLSQPQSVTLGKESFIV
jgi:hypothetical protein